MANVVINIKDVDKNILFLELRPISFVQKTNTYFWAIDNYFLKGEENLKKVLLNIEIMLKKWIKYLEENNSSNAIVYLPFDFEDEYIGCLKIFFLSKVKIKIEYGYTEKYQGCCISPSQWNNIDYIIDDYDNLSDSFEEDLNDFIKDLNFSINQINKKIG